MDADPRIELDDLFRQEAEDLLADLEAVALELETADADPALIDSAFRILHTLKGTASMYGYEAVGSLAHELEGAYAAVRDGAAPITADLAALTLGVKDWVATAMTSEAESMHGSDNEKLLAACRALPRSDVKASEHSDRLKATACYRITLAPSESVAARGLNPLGVIDELRSLGACDVVANTSAVPDLEELDVDRTYVTWDVTLRTSSSESDVASVFMFLESHEFECALADDDVPASLASRDLTGGLDSRATKRIDYVRVAAPKLDGLVDLVGELVTAHATISGLAERAADPAVVSLAEEIGRLTTELRESVLDIRMVPISSTFGRFRRHVRDLALDLGKRAEVITEGGDTELDKTVMDRIEQPLVHIVRNCLDHGIEMPEERLAAGKPAHGTIRLNAYQSGGRVHVEVCDDGRGLDHEAVVERARSAGLVAEGEQLVAAQIEALTFAPGLSTREAVTNISGRGVGLDSVRRTVQELQGTVAISSSEGSGTRVSITLPLTLAIVDALLVRVAGDSYLLPLSVIEECVEVNQADAWRDHGRDLIDVRGEIVPFVRLREFFGITGAHGSTELAVIVSVDGQRLGIVVDSIEDQLQAVIKTLGRAIAHTDGVSGASVLGDGRVALIIDAGELMRIADAGQGSRADMGVMRA